MTVLARSLLVSLAVGSLLVGLAGRADATWSIVAVDQETGQVGVAMASCVPAGLLGEPDEALVPVVLLPGRAAAVTQGSIDPDAPAALRQVLADGAAPQLAIDTVLELDEQPTARQFGIVLLDDVDGSWSAAYTGADAEQPRGDRVGDNASAQGVLLADPAVVDRAFDAFNRARAEGRSLDRALAAGLVAGSEAGGDRRCDDQTALFAHLAVAGPADDPRRPSTLLTVTVDEGDGQNPVPMLANALAEGRSGWVDAGLSDPVGVPRVVVLAVGTVLAVAAAFTLWKGMGSPSARR